MKAVGFKEFGDPEVLEVMELPDVTPGNGQIKVENFS